MYKSVMRKYARLIARVGANIQKGQTVRLYINADRFEFAELMTEECYKAGASRVDIEWSSQCIQKLHYKYRSLQSLSEVPEWEKEKLRLMTEELPCRIYIISDDPDGFNGTDQDKMQKASMARYPVIKHYRDAIENKHQWTIAAIPSYEWAKKVFPSLSKKAAYEKLWTEILNSVYVSRDNDPVNEWKSHNAQLKSNCDKLNEYKFERLEYKNSRGTDFTVWLIPEGHWCGGSEETKQGIVFNPNMPTQEVFTSPQKGRAEGTLVASKPLSYEGQLIEDFSITFKNGRAVSWEAKKGKELLDKMLTMDDGASMLGELALISFQSPINKSGILFYETLFDENAVCHVALGAGFNDTIDGYLEKSNEECRALGINDSIIHVDFMIGTEDLNVTGYKNGNAVPIFINGTWADSFSQDNN